MVPPCYSNLLLLFWTICYNGILLSSHHLLQDLEWGVDSVSPYCLHFFLCLRPNFHVSLSPLMLIRIISSILCSKSSTINYFYLEQLNFKDQQKLGHTDFGPLFIYNILKLQSHIIGT